MKLTLILLLLPLLLLTGCQTGGLFQGPPRNFFFEDPVVLRLVRAAELGRVSEVTRLVQEEGIDVNARGKDGVTPLLFHVIYSNNRQGLIALLDNGADPEIFHDRGNSAVHEAAKKDQSFFLEELLKRGANPNIITLPRGQSPLRLAALRNRYNNVSVLLKNGADIDQPDSTGETVMMRSANGRNVEMAYYLLQQGADPLIVDNRGRDLNDILLTGNFFGENAEYRDKIIEELKRRGIWREERTDVPQENWAPAREFTDPNQFRPARQGNPE